LGWDDGRLVVFHVMVVMFEIDAAAVQPPRYGKVPAANLPAR